MHKKKRKVPIENILFMFSFIWDKIEAFDDAYVNNNDTFDSPDILATLFLTNTKEIMQHGLYKEYFLTNEEIRGIKGKINFTESLNNLSFQNSKAICEYDELTHNNLINQIIKTTCYRLYKNPEINEHNKRALNNILLYFNQVDIIDLNNKSFNIKFNRNNYYTYYLILICKLIFDLTMLSEEKGNYLFKDFLDDDECMSKIFELFIYKFYLRKTHYQVSYQKILNWQVQGGDENWLPNMQLDIVLEDNEKTIIIDTKYYKEFFTNSYNYKENQESNKKFYSNNLYQIYAYMNQINTNKELTGILLYPVPYSNHQIAESYGLSITNNKKATMKIQTINLNQPHQKITQALKALVEEE